MQKKQFNSIKTILNKNDFVERLVKRNKYIKTEHQDYGIRLSNRLNDPYRKGLYINLAKELPRNLLETAVQFALDYPVDSEKNKAKIFMWKLKELCDTNNYKIPYTKRRLTNKQKINKIQTRLFK